MELTKEELEQVAEVTEKAKVDSFKEELVMYEKKLEELNKTLDMAEREYAARVKIYDSVVNNEGIRRIRPEYNYELSDEYWESKLVLEEIEWKKWQVGFALEIDQVRLQKNAIERELAKIKNSLEESEGEEDE